MAAALLLGSAQFQPNANASFNYLSGGNNFTGNTFIPPATTFNNASNLAAILSLPASTGPLFVWDTQVDGGDRGTRSGTYYYGVGAMTWNNWVNYSLTTINNQAGAVMNGTITNTGKALAAGFYSYQQYGYEGTDSLHINNAGTMEGISTNNDSTVAGIYAFNLYGNAAVTNYAGGLCLAAGTFDATGINVGVDYGSVNVKNDGTITAIAYGGQGDDDGLAYAQGIDLFGYDNSSGSPLSFTNSGTVECYALGKSSGTNICFGTFMWAEGGSMTFNNAGTCYAQATDGCSGAYVGGNRGPDLINNWGTIQGVAPYGGWGLGVENDTGTANDTYNTITINNWGTISHNTGYGLFMYAGHGYATINNYGTISGGGECIHTYDYPGNTTVNVHGPVQAASAGNLAINLGTGNNTVNVYGLPLITGLINGGRGVNAVNTLNFALSGVLQQVNGQAANQGHYLAAYNLGRSGSIVVSGLTYTWENFSQVTGTVATNAGTGPIYKAATNTDLSAGTSWNGGIAPDVGNIACWTNASLGAGLTLNSAVSWAGMKVVGAVSDIAITGTGPLALGTNGVDLSASPVNLTLNTPVILTANQTWNVTAGKSLSESRVISGNGGLAKAGAGLLVLTNANTFAGGTTVNGGTLALDYNVGDTTTGTLAGGTAITVNPNATLRLDIEDALGFYGGIPSQLNVNGGLVTSAAVVNTTPVQSGGASFRVTLPTLYFQGGTLSSGTNNHGDTYGGSYLVGGTNYTLASTNTAVINAYAISIQNNATFTVAAGTTPSGVDLDVSSILKNWVSGAQSLTKAGPGVMKLDGANTYSGPTMISAGALALAGSGSIANTPGIVITGGATFDVSGLSSPFVLGGSQTLSNSSPTAVFKGSASTGTGTLALNYAAGTPALTVSNGTLTVSSGTVFQINNLGSQLAVGSYKLIAKSSGGAVGGTVTTNPVPVGGGGAAVSAKLAIVNGELNLVVGNPVNPNPTNITVKVSGNMLKLSWPADHLGWTLQTNSVGLAASNQWFAYPGSAATTNINIPINSAKTNVFFRMSYP